MGIIKNLIAIVNRVEFRRVEFNKFKEDKWVVLMAVFYDIGVYGLDLIDVFASLKQRNGLFSL